MPHIKITGLESPTIKQLSKETSTSLSVSFQCPVDWIVFSNNNTTLYCNAEEVTNMVYVYIEWFDRGQSIQDEVAKILTSSILVHNPNLSIDIIFIKLEKSSYYENGVHY